jgi:hypothetical protein
LANKVESLLVWNGTTGTDKIFGAAGTSIFDVTASGAVGAAAVTGLTNARWQSANISTAGGHFLMIVNGADTPRSYNGTVWAVPAITGVVGGATTLVNLALFKNRLFFAQVNSMDVYYLPAESIAGATAVLPLGAVFRWGGYVMAMGSFSNDAGEGPDDYLAVISSNGEVAVYQGTDPDSDLTWALVGLFDMGDPIGRRCVARLNGDLGIVTQDGAISMQAALRFDRASDQRASVTAKIQPLYNELTTAGGTYYGWQSITFPKTSYYLVNVPTLDDETASIQLVMNTYTGAWCKFEGLNAICWAVANDELFFGSSTGTVWQADSGYLDNGSAIEFEAIGAWQSYGGGSQKYFTAVRPTLLTGGTVSYAIGVDVDFLTTTPPGVIPSHPNGASLTWPFTWPFTWGGTNVLDTRWFTAGAIGTWAAVHFKGQTRGGAVQINSFEVVHQRGGIY